MQLVPLTQVPNQSFTVRLDSSRYDITIKEARGRMVVDMARDDVVLFRGLVAKTGTPLIPYRYLELGNFVFITDGEVEPYFELFNVSQQLVYLTLAEVEALRANG